MSQIPATPRAQRILFKADTPTIHYSQTYSQNLIQPPTPVATRSERLSPLEPPYAILPPPSSSSRGLLAENYPEIFDSDAFQTRRKLLTAHQGGVFREFEALLEIDKTFNLEKSPYLDKGTRRLNPHTRSLAILTMVLLGKEVRCAMIQGRVTALQNVRNKIPSLTINAWPDKDKTAPKAGDDALTSSGNQLRPAIYGNILANSRGQWLTKNEFLKLLKWLEMYMRFCRLFFEGKVKPTTQTADIIGHAQSIDSHMPNAEVPAGYDKDNVATEVRLGKRKYIASVKKLEEAQAWMKHMRRALARIPAEKADEQLPWSVYEVGWTINAKSRLDDHKKHQGSPPLMNLVECIVQLGLSERGYAMQQFIFLEVPKHALAPVAEHVVSQFCLSYSYLGGFNVVTAGTSVRYAFTQKTWIWDHYAKRQFWQRISRELREEEKLVKEYEDNAKKVEEAFELQREATELYTKLVEDEKKVAPLESAIETIVAETTPKINNWVDATTRNLELLEEETAYNDLLRKLIELTESYNASVRSIKRDAIAKCKAEGITPFWSARDEAEDEDVAVGATEEDDIVVGAAEDDTLVGAAEYDPMDDVAQVQEFSRPSARTTAAVAQVPEFSRPAARTTAAVAQVPELPRPSARTTAAVAQVQGLSRPAARTTAAVAQVQGLSRPAARTTAAYEPSPAEILISEPQFKRALNSYVQAYPYNPSGKQHKNTNAIRKDVAKWFDDTRGLPAMADRIRHLTLDDAELLKIALDDCTRDAENARWGFYN